MTNVQGSKDGGTWEEVTRQGQTAEYNRFSNQQYIKNLTLLKEWCERKIEELNKKQDESK